jgi:redox-sensitive bicupin YhaK (pirin superfamily)
MTAGTGSTHGIAHTEQTPENVNTLHAVQLWIALPMNQEIAPNFEHYPDLPAWQENGADYVLTTGAFGGRRAPTTQHSPLVGVDIQVREAQTLTIEAEAGWEYGALVITGSVAAADGTRAGADELLFIEQAEGSFTLAAEAGTHIMLLGGEPLPHPTVMWWNFVADSREAIAQAVADWNNHHPRFGQEIDLSGSTLKRLVAPEAPAGIR